MAANTNLSANGGAPEITVKCGNLNWYRYRVFLWKPGDEKWPDGKSFKKIREGIFDTENNALDTFPIGMDAGDLDGYHLSWEFYIKMPGGGTGQYSVVVQVKQGDEDAMNPPYTAGGQVKNVKIVADSTELMV